MNRIVAVLIVVPLAIILIALAVANRAPVALTFDPFNPGNPALTIQAPLFIIVIFMVAIGMLIGSLVTWLKQSHYRKKAREAVNSTAVTRPRA